MSSDGRPDPRTARWTDLEGEAKGATYDARWARLAAEGRSVHGEADLVWDLLDGRVGATVLDAGCGTGRVAVELARRGADVLGVDRDHDLVAAARAKTADDRHRADALRIRWAEADLLDVGRLQPAHSLDLAVLAGNVMVFVDPGTERSVLGEVSRVVRPGGLVVAGFQLRPDGYDVDRFDADAAAVGLRLRDRWSTWGRDPWAGHDYQVSVHVVGADPRG